MAISPPCAPESPTEKTIDPDANSLVPVLRPILPEELASPVLNLIEPLALAADAPVTPLISPPFPVPPDPLLS